MAEIDQAQLKAVVLKLLDKAGLDPRLTPRILRNKVEDKMSITRGGLKVKREYIKTLIFKWWKVNNPESTITSGPLPSIKATLSSSSSSAEKAKIEPTEDDKEWKALIRVAKAGDKWPLLGKGLGALEVKEKKSELRKRYVYLHISIYDYFFIFDLNFIYLFLNYLICS